MRSQVGGLCGKQIQTEFFVVEKVFSFLPMTLDTVVWHPTLYAALTGSCCERNGKKKVSKGSELTREKLAQWVGTEHEQSSHVRCAF